MIGRRAIRPAIRRFATQAEAESFRQRLKQAPVDANILSRLRAMGLGHRRGERQAKREIKKMQVVARASQADLEESMDPPSAFAGKARLVMAANTDSKFPPEGTRKEIAFAGRANVGKSSLMNRLLGRFAGEPHSARVEDKPGVTRTINFYDKSKKLRLVDLPGYGFAFTNRDKVQSWTDLVMSYLLNRECLNRVYVLVDGRHGLKQPDKELIALLDEARVKHQIVLTKGDLVKQVDLAKQIWHIGLEAEKSKYCLTPILAISSLTGAGIADFRERAAQNLPQYKECHAERKKKALERLQKQREAAGLTREREQQQWQKQSTPSKMKVRKASQKRGPGGRKRRR